MMFARLRDRYQGFASRVLSSLSEIERQDVHAFDHWFSQERGWRWIVYIVAATTLVAWLVSRLPLNLSFLETALLFNVAVLVLAWASMSAWFGYRKFQGRSLRFTLVTVVFVLLGAAAGGTVADLARGRAPFTWFVTETTLRSIIVAALVFGLVYAATVALIAHLRNREYLAKAARLEGEARQSELSRRLAESQLRMLQLQVEPHFLFNTLGSAQQLAEKGAPEAARLITDLIRFLRSTTESLRENATTVTQDAAMVSTYLAIMQTRLRDRLHYVVDIEDAAGRHPIPPGMLITLVENAIKHGIEPSAAGGTITVGARADASGGEDSVVITVADTGAGLEGARPGQGIGLANIRERLALLYGSRARLDLEANEPRGFVARLRLPRVEAAHGPVPVEVHP